MTMSRSLTRAGTVLLVCGALNTQAQYSYTTISVPGASSTWAYGISGNSIVGVDFVTVSSTSNSVTGYYQSFLFDGSTYTTLNVPAPSGQGTGASGVSGNNIVGSYPASGGIYHGFLYNGSSYTTLDVPGADSTWASGISSNNIVGSYIPTGSLGRVGFVYDGSSYTTLSFPGATSTQAYGIDGNNIVGVYGSSTKGYPIGFVYNGSTYTTLITGTQAFGISGNDIVGAYNGFANNHFGEHGFLYDGSGYTILEAPGGTQTWAYGISGGNIVGYYQTPGGGAEGFLAVPVPEPAAFALLAVGTLLFPLAKKQKQPQRDDVV
jgi:hypothetical protein